MAKLLNYCTINCIQMISMKETAGRVQCVRVVQEVAAWVTRMVVAAEVEEDHCTVLDPPSRM